MFHSTPSTKSSKKENEKTRFFHGSQSIIAYIKSNSFECNEKSKKIKEKRQIVWVSGGGSDRTAWRRFQTPYFDHDFCNITYDNRGIGHTLCPSPPPWSLDDFATDLMDLIHGICQPPVILIGASLGAAIVQQVLIRAPDLVSCAIVMGTGAWSTGWSEFYQQAEIDFRKSGLFLDKGMSVAHYAAMLYPARALGDRVLWPKLRQLLEEWIDTGDSESTVVSQWTASVTYDQRPDFINMLSSKHSGKCADYPFCPVHVIAFSEDIEAPPQDGKELADMIPGAQFHLVEGAGHCSWYGHMHNEINELISEILECIDL